MKRLLSSFVRAIRVVDVSHRAQAIGRRVGVESVAVDPLCHRVIVTQLAKAGELEVSK